uniref:PNPLA domain-containing protein n=1 Tax=viral metagenome TaxID=1070528 RepID=A0A6C0BU92_9ZZZZ
MTTITTLVLSGGAYNGLIELGVLRRLSEKGFYDINAVKRIHGTSIGGFIAVLLALKMDWCDLVEYFVERPWHKLLSINPIELYTKKGAFDKQFFISALSPLFASKELDIATISLGEFKEYSNIELYFYAIKLSTFEVCEISDKDILLIDAVTMTCCMPLVFRPVIHKGEYYIDGGIACNYPLREVINAPDADVSKILGIRFDLGDTTTTINENSNIIEYIYCLFNKISTIREFNKVELGIIPNEIVIRCAGINATDGYDALFKRDKREEMVKQGERVGDEWLMTSL